MNPITKKFYYIMAEGNRTKVTGANSDELDVTDTYRQFLEAEAVTERAWRNYELTNTDWMLVVDATYGGEPLAGSQKLDDILTYRLALREYNLTTDDRPERPEWFKG